MKEIVRIAEEAILKASNGRILSIGEIDERVLFIKIKDEAISFTIDIKDIEDVDECMIFLPSYWNNTVNNKYGSGTVTFKNFCYVLLFVDSELNVHDNYAKDNFLIMCSGNNYYNIIIQLYYDGNGLVKLLETPPTEEGFQRIWDSYQSAKKCLQTQKEEFENKRKELEGEIDLLSENYSKLSQQYETIVESISKLSQLTKKQE